MSPFAWWIIRAGVFLALALPTCLFAFIKGRRPEQLTASTVIVAIAATTLIPEHSYSSVVTPLILIDVVVLMIVVTIALTADRYWPMYFGAIQLITVAVHGVRAIDQNILPSVYARFTGQLAYPTLVVLAVGTWRHIRRGAEPDWTWQARDQQVRGLSEEG